MNRRIPEPQAPYIGFEGAFAAKRDGKVWLNNVDLLFPLLADFMVLEARYFAFKIAGTHDSVSPVWPSFEEQTPYFKYNNRAARIENFLRIFSGIDERFAYDLNYLPGGGLEMRIAEEYGSEDYDPRNDPTASKWYSPINAQDPLAAPANMRLLNIYLNGWNASFYGMAASALSGELMEVLRGRPVGLTDPSDDSVYSFGLMYAKDGTLAVHFHEVLCSWVAMFVGMPEEPLIQSIKPLKSDLELYFSIVAVHPDKLDEGEVTVISRPDMDKWRRLDDIE
jgi:hypothetical protein